MDVIYIHDERGIHRTYGKIELDIKNRYRINLMNRLDGYEIGKEYRVELPSERVVFIGYLSSDRKTIIER